MNSPAEPLQYIFDDIVLQDTGWRTYDESPHWTRVWQWIYPATSAITGERVWLKYAVEVKMSKQDLEGDDAPAEAMTQAMQKPLSTIRSLLVDAAHGIGHLLAYDAFDAEHPKRMATLQHLGGDPATWTIPIAPISRDDMIAHRDPWADIVAR